MRKGVVSYLIILFAAIALVAIIFWIFVAIAWAEVTGKSSQEIFQDAMKYANSLRDSIEVKGENKVLQVKVMASDQPFMFKPEEVFKESPGGYSANPSQAGYYEGITQSNAITMENVARDRMDDGNSIDSGSISSNNSNNNDGDGSGATMNAVSDPNNNDRNQDNSKRDFSLLVSRSIKRNFQTRPVFKITQNDEYIAKGSATIAWADNVISGTSGNGINCEDKDKIVCKSEYLKNKKECNEEVRPIKRICEKTPRVEITTHETIYPNCKRLDVRQGANSYCPSGYRELLYTDMLRGPTWDDIFICGKQASEGETNECYLGYLVQGIYHSNNRSNDHENIRGKGDVPKGIQGYIRFMHTYNGAMPGVIFNETKNQLYRSGEFAGGEIVALPISYDEDQVFRFDLLDGGKVGVVVFYVNRINHLKDTKIRFEEHCRDI